MDNLKTIIGVVVGSLLLVAALAFGFSKMTKNQDQVTANVDLTAGARFVKENGEPKVTVVEFSDMQCPACKSAEPIAKELRGTEGVKFVYRHFPLITIHQNAWKGARAVEAANIMGKGWEMMELMFDKQEEWSGVSGDSLTNLYKGYAKQIGLDENKFVETFNSDITDKNVQADANLGNQLKLGGTPTFYVNGQLVASGLVISQVKQLLGK